MCTADNLIIAQLLTKAGGIISENGRMDFFKCMQKYLIKKLSIKAQ